MISFYTHCISSYVSEHTARIFRGDVRKALAGDTKMRYLSGYIGLESIKSIGHCTLETTSKYFKHHHPQQIASLTIFDSLRFRFGQELLSLQLRDSEPVISATKGRIFFFRRSVGQWFSFSSTTSEEELLAGGFSMFL